MKFVESGEGVGKEKGQFRRTSLNMHNNTEHIEETLHMNSTHTFYKQHAFISVKILISIVKLIV